jgi:hypothetical protein
MLWCSSVFHFILIISPGLQPVGFGSYRHTTSASTPNPNLKMAAAITVPSFYQNNAIPHYPFMWPGRGQTISQTTYAPETPDARTSCNYTGDAGQPIFLLTGWRLVSGQVTSNVTSQPVSGSLLLNGVTSVPVCVIDENNFTYPDPVWQARGRGLLNYEGAVVLLPQNPLAYGNYTVEIAVGNQTYRWSFGVGPPISYGELHYIQGWAGGYLDVRGVDPGGNLLAVSTATSNQRDGFSGTWKILSAATPAKTGPVLVNDIIYLQNQYAGPYFRPGGVAPSDPNVLGGYLDVRGSAAPPPHAPRR